MVHEERHDSRVDRAAARAHHQAVERRQAHRGVHGDAMVDGAHGAAVAQMAGDELQVLQRLVEHDSRALGDVAVRRAVGAVLADGVLLVILVRKRVHVGLRRQRLEERGVEHGDHRNIRHVLLTRADAHESRLIVKRGELGKLVDLLNDVIVDEDRLVEVLAALDDTVPDRIDLVEGFDGGVVAVNKRVQYERHGCVMVGHLRIDDHFVLIDSVLVEGVCRAHALADALRDNSMIFDVDKLVFQRGRARIDDQNVQQPTSYNVTFW